LFSIQLSRDHHSIRTLCHLNVRSDDSLDGQTLRDRFTFTARVGSGTYGQAWLATRPNDPNQKLSVKHPRITREDQAIPPSIFRELALLSEVNYPHIVDVSRNDIVLDSEVHLLSFASEYGSVDIRKIVTYYSSVKKT
jgi:serine/threonine protein kinase